MNKNALAKFVLRAYWGDQLVEIPGCDGGDSLFYLEDCGHFLGPVITGCWYDLWNDPDFAEPVWDAVEDGRNLNGDIEVLRAVAQMLDRA